MEFLPPKEVGIVMLIFAGIWALLALPHWGPLRRRWESKPTRLFSIEDLGDHQFGSPGKNGFANAIAGELMMLRILVGFRTIPYAVVQSIKLEVKGKRLLSDWKTVRVSDGYSQYVYFEVPKWLSGGQYKAKLVTSAGGREWYSDDIIIKFPEQREGS